jgi:hypothetical protein
MAAKSHVDLCLFLQILEIAEDRIPEKLKAPLLSRESKEIHRALSEIQSDGNSLGGTFIDEQTSQPR